MSYPGYPGHGGAGHSYPPYPNSQPRPEHATSSLSYANVGFQAPLHSPYPSHAAMPEPYSAALIPVPVAPGPYPPYQPYPPTASPYPPTSSPYPPTSSPYPPTSSPYPPTSSPYPPTSSPYPPTSSPYPPTSSPYPPASVTHPSVTNPYPPATSLYQPIGNPNAQAVNPHPAQSHPPTSSSMYSPGFGAPQYGSPNPYHITLMPSATPLPAGHSSHSFGSVRKGHPTVQPIQPFDPRSDAEVLRKAMKGFGTDEKAIINVLARRSNQQRQEIALQFKTLYGKDLISDLKSELSGKFEVLVIALMKPHFELMAQEVHDAIAGLGTDEETIVEIMCSTTNQEIHYIKSAYQHMYNRTLEEDLKGDTSGNFKRLMVSLCMGNRSEDYNVDPSAAQDDAKALLRGGELRVGTDESTFNAVLCQRSYAHLQAVIIEYQRLTGHSLEKAIKKEFSGDIEEGLCTILRCVENRPGYFAERLYKSMKGVGTDDGALVRLVVSRCEADMGDIKQAFEAKYGKTLASFITGDTSGDYKKCLLALIGEY